MHAKAPQSVFAAREIIMERRVLRTPAAAEYVGLSPATLEKQRLVGKGPRFIRLGNRAVGYEVRDLDAWIEAQRRATIAPPEPR